MVGLKNSGLRTRTNTSKSRCRLERLEERTLLSAWSTVAAGTSMNSGNIGSMASDAAGNVYAVGYTSDANPNDPGISIAWEKPAGSGAWQPIANLPNVKAVAADKQGNVFFTGSNTAFTTWELPAGSSSVVTIDTDTIPGGQGEGLGFDAAGNLYAVGNDAPLSKFGTGYPQFVVRKGVFSSGKWSFTTVDRLSSKYNNYNSAYSVVTTPRGVFVSGSNEYGWVIRGSATGAAGTWSTVDTFSLDSSLSAYSSAFGITADSAGHLYVAGTAQTLVAVPGSRPKVYNKVNWWVVRGSSTGAAGTWSTLDNSQNWSPSQAGAARAIVHDASDNVYVAGGAFVSGGGEPGLVRVRSAATGAWATSDVAPVGAVYDTLTIDSLGNLYGGGEATNAAGTLDDYFIRSKPAAPTNLTAVADPVAPSSQIDLSWANAAGSDETGFAVYRSTDGVTFTLLGTVDASTTGYTDTGLSAGTKYYYYVVTLLNSDGSSVPSGTVSATTSL